MVCRKCSQDFCSDLLPIRLCEAFDCNRFKCKISHIRAHFHFILCGQYCKHTCSVTYPFMHYSVAHNVNHHALKWVWNLMFERRIFAPISSHNPEFTYVLFLDIWLLVWTPQNSCMMNVAHHQALRIWIQSQNLCLTNSLMLGSKTHIASKWMPVRCVPSNHLVPIDHINVASLPECVGSHAWDHENL